MAKNAFNKRTEFFQKIEKAIELEGNYNYRMDCRIEQIGNLDIKKVQKRKIIVFLHVEMAKY